MPLSCLYGMGVSFRNMLFDMGILKAHDFSIPVISVGNITVGGTGKTPHVEYLIRLLGQERVAVLSRGYKRKSRGFLKADATTTAREIGDEPFQMKQKFPLATVAVDKDRVHGIGMLTAQQQDIDAILLDDAYQHRYVKPGINILLIDYHRLAIYDKLLPAGRLREPFTAKKRADIVIVTKCPRQMKPMEFRVINKAMDLYPYQQLFFTTLEYGALQPVFRNEAHHGEEMALSQLSEHHLLLLTGIASPRQMMEDLQPYCANISHLSFPDHHNFSTRDIEQINSSFATLPSPKCIVTTEKDAARILTIQGLSQEVRENLYALPIHIRFMLDQEEDFCKSIKGYVFRNAKDSILVKQKNTEPVSQPQEKNKPHTISFR